MSGNGTVFQARSLYRISVNAVGKWCNEYATEIRSLPNDIQFDTLHEVHRNGSHQWLLKTHLGSLDIFMKLVCCKNKRVHLHQMFQALMNQGAALSLTLSNTYVDLCSKLQARMPADCTATSMSIGSKSARTIHIGLTLGAFLVESAWFAEAEAVYESCLNLVKLNKDVDISAGAAMIEIYAQLARVYVGCCNYDKAQVIINRGLNLLADNSLNHHFDTCITELHGDGVHACMPHVKTLQDGGLPAAVPSAAGYLASLYADYASLLLAAKGPFNVEVEVYCEKAMRSLCSRLPVKINIDVTRTCAKIYILRQDLKMADPLIKFAVKIARTSLGAKHPKYAEVLQDYGFYLLCAGNLDQSVHIYQEALDICTACFGRRNLNVAACLQDLAYAIYLHEYNTGCFTYAKHYIQQAINIFESVLGVDNARLASARRIKALILEEVAADCGEMEDFQKHFLLKEAQSLHTNSLLLLYRAFGDCHLQTAKQYSSLGRLYQTMGLYKDSEIMQKKAIEIQTSLLGASHYEVAASMSLLAALYSDHMGLYDAPEALYLHSLDIGTQVFGAGHSGLEYEYRGLVKLHESKGDEVQVAHYKHLLQECLAQNNDREETKGNIAHSVFSSHDVAIWNVPSLEELLVQTCF